jgi:hypothetical protein
MLRSGGLSGLVCPREPARARTTDRRSNARVDRWPALDCREHPPAERARRPGMSTPERGPLDGLGSAIGRVISRRARLKWWLESWEPEKTVRGVGLVGVPRIAPPEYFWPTTPRRAFPQRIQHRRDSASEWKQTHHIPQGRRQILCESVKGCSWGGSIPLRRRAAAAFSGSSPHKAGSARQTGPGPFADLPSRRLREA